MSNDDDEDVSRLITTTLQILSDPDPPRIPEFGAHSPKMRALMDLAARAAPVDDTVLITGESGVGKEWLARWLHDASPRARGCYVPVNCGAFADTLVESELFGHVRGAFTGALKDHAGVFEAAHRGTLLLDEIGEVSSAMQVKLLRVIEAREVRRVGETTARPVDFRLIAATNRDLPRAVAENRFREDLYYRLHVIDLHVPPLRERPEDLRTLADHFLAHAAARLRRPIVAFEPEAMDRILHYPWPGNIRELEHAIRRACLAATGPRLIVEDLPSSVRHGTPDRDARPLREGERDHILKALERHHGDRVRTAEELRISLSTLNRKLRRYGGSR
jgi:transcriptional regulator with PAS, ATPase and Fis domain